MNLVWAALIVAVGRGTCVAAMLFVRRRAPRAATSPTATGPPASSACSRRASRSWSGSSSSSRSRATTSPASARRRRRSPSAPAGDRAVLPGAGRRRAERRARLLRPLGHPRRVAAGGGRKLRRRGEPLGRRALQHRARLPAARRRAGDGLRQVARPHSRAGGGSTRSAPWCGRRDPVAPLGGPDPALDRDRRLHAVLRRQRRASAVAGCAHGIASRRRSPRCCS